MTATINQDSIRETLNKAYPFSVDKFPLFGPEYAKTSHYGLFRDDTAQCIGSAVGKGYQPHTLDDIATLAEAAMQGFLADNYGDDGAKLNCHWAKGHHVTISPSDSHRQSIFGTKDNIFPRFIVHAGYGGKAFSASLGLYRDCCTNLAELTPAGESVSIKIRHTHSLRPRLEDLVSSFRNLASKWTSIVVTARQLEATEIDLQDFIREVYPQSLTNTHRANTMQHNRAYRIVQRIMSERLKTGRDNPNNLKTATAWEAYNGVQGYVQHTSTRRGRPTHHDRAILALGDTNVKRAMQHALALSQ